MKKEEVIVLIKENIAIRLTVQDGLKWGALHKSERHAYRKEAEKLYKEAFGDQKHR